MEKTMISLTNGGTIKSKNMSPQEILHFLKNGAFDKEMIKAGIMGAEEALKRARYNLTYNHFKTENLQ